MANKLTKRCSASLVIRETEIKTTMKCHFISSRMAIIKQTNIKNVEKMEPSYIAGGNIKCYSHHGNSIAIPQEVNYVISMLHNNFIPR